jgi:hypothetical protein
MWPERLRALASSNWFMLTPWLRAMLLKVSFFLTT